MRRVSLGRMLASVLEYPGVFCLCEPGLLPCHVCTGKEMTKKEKAYVSKTHTRKICNPAMGK